MFPQESQGLKNGELQLRLLRGTAFKACQRWRARRRKGRWRVLCRIKSSRMRRIDARTTVLGLLAATQVTIDAAVGRARAQGSGRPVSSV
jgi:hypothetical protein